MKKWPVSKKLENKEGKPSPRFYKSAIFLPPFLFGYEKLFDGLKVKWVLKKLMMWVSGWGDNGQRDGVGGLGLVTVVGVI